MSDDKQEVYKILELGTDEKNLHKHKNTGGLLYIDLSMIKFSSLSTYIRKQDKEIERLNNIIKQQNTRNSRQRVANKELQKIYIKLKNTMRDIENYIKLRTEDNYSCSVCTAITDDLLERIGSDKE